MPDHPSELPLVELDATEQARLVQSGELTPTELVTTAITRIERLNPAINALSSWNFDLARERAATVSQQGSFAGVPTLLKDLLAYPGHATAYGTRLLAGHVTAEGTPYTEALDAGGLVVLGKSATSEFGLLGSTEPLSNGATRNPWDRELSPGGSSGGAAAAIASGMVPVAHASDGGGSIRGPASFCGVFGFKPSRGRTLFAGIPPEMPTAALLSEHCISRTVRDSATWLRLTETDDYGVQLPAADILAQTAPEPLRIGLYKRDAFGKLPDRNALEAVETGAALCASMGHEVIEVDGPDFDAEAASEAFFDLTAMTIAYITDSMASGMGPAFDDTLLEPYTREVISRARELEPDRPAQAKQILDAAGTDIVPALDGLDVLLSPSVPCTAFPLGSYGPAADMTDLMAQTRRLAGYTVPASLAGWPAMSVPLHWTAGGLPIGCHFAAAPGNDALLFRLAFQLEANRPWLPKLASLSRNLACPNA